MLEKKINEKHINIYADIKFLIISKHIIQKVAKKSIFQMMNQKAQGGLWNSSRPVISNDTQNLLKGLF